MVAPGGMIQHASLECHIFMYGECGLAACTTYLRCKPAVGAADHTWAVCGSIKFTGPASWLALLRHTQDFHVYQTCPLQLVTRLAGTLSVLLADKDKAIDGPRSDMPCVWCQPQ